MENSLAALVRAMQSAAFARTKFFKVFAHFLLSSSSQTNYKQHKPQQNAIGSAQILAGGTKGGVTLVLSPSPFMG